MIRCIYMVPVTGVGMDMVEVARFKGMAADHPFVEKTFAAEERARCFVHEDPSPHLAGIFAAKEAAWKALTVQDFPFYEIEIRKDAAQKPEAWHQGNLLPLRVSITHTDALAAAVAIAYA